MSKLMQFLTSGDERREFHPKARYWRSMLEAGKAATLECEFLRERQGLGFGPARLYVTLLDSAKRPIGPPDEVAWDPEIDTDLLELKARARTLANEAERTGMAFGSRFSQLESAYGSAWFNAVLVKQVRELFGDEPAVRAKLEAIAEDSPSIDSALYQRCVSEIEGVIADRGKALSTWLGYTQDQARDILDKGMAYFLDEKFMLTSRALLGLR